MSYNFRFAGTWLSELYAVTTKRPPLEVAQYDFTLLDSPGRSGSEFIDNKCYKNVPMTREIGFVERPSSIIDFEERVIEWLAYNQGYREFEDTDHPGLVTRAVLTNFAEVQIILRRHKKAALKFSREPFWYSKSGLEPVVMADEAAALAGVTLNNPYPAEAEPLVEVVVGGSISSSKSFRIMIGDYIMYKTMNDYNVTSTRNHIIFDIENQEIRTQNADGTDVKYADVAAPSALAGLSESTVKIVDASSGLIQSVSVIPKWRRL